MKKQKAKEKVKKEPIYKDFKCPNCFKRWEEPRKNKLLKSYEEKLCDYCVKHKKDMTDKMMVNRMLRIMPTTYVHDFPKIFQKTIKIMCNMRIK